MRQNQQTVVEYGAQLVILIYAFSSIPPLVTDYRSSVSSHREDACAACPPEQTKNCQRYRESSDRYKADEPH